MDGWMDGWMDSEPLRIVSGFSTLARVLLVAYGCESVYAFLAAASVAHAACMSLGRQRASGLKKHSIVLSPLHSFASDACEESAQSDRRQCRCFKHSA